MSNTDVKTMDERTVTPLARVILAFPESSRTPAMVEELERQMAIAHRSDIITGVGEWLRDSGQATDLVGKATSGERPRAVWMKFTRTTGRDLFRYSLYFTKTEPFVVGLWIHRDDSDTPPPRGGWHLMTFLDVADFQTGGELMGAVTAFLESDDAYLDCIYRWLEEDITPAL